METAEATTAAWIVGIVAGANFASEGWVADGVGTRAIASGDGPGGIGAATAAAGWRALTCATTYPIPTSTTAATKTEAMRIPRVRTAATGSGRAFSGIVLP